MSYFIMHSIFFLVQLFVFHSCGKIAKSHPTKNFSKKIYFFNAWSFLFMAYELIFMLKYILILL